MHYFALDVETSNADRSSICQIGIVEIRNGEIVSKWVSLVNPEAYFDPFNTSIHGITESDVSNAPTFDTLHDLLAEKLTGRITVHHMPFDKTAVTRACLEYDLEILQPNWLDSAKIARRTWEEFTKKGYSLANVAKRLGIEFSHHDALEDAIAAAKIVEHACKKTGLSVEEWLERVDRRSSMSGNINLEGNSGGALHGENLAFTGKLFLPRKEAAQIAANIGCNVSGSVSQKTTILVVGHQDLNKLAGYEKSSKHRKVEDLIEQGFPIKILSEKDFVETCNTEDGDLNLEIPKPSERPHAEKELKADQNKNSADLGITVDLDGIFDEEFDKLTDEEQEYQPLLDSIKDCSQKEKRKRSKEFNSVLEKIAQYRDKFKIDTLEYDSAGLVDIIDDATDEIKDTLYELAKNKISMADFYIVIDSAMDEIETGLDENQLPQVVKDYADAVTEELEGILEKILRYAN